MADKQNGDDLLSDELIPIRKMCAVYDVTPRALRFYEAEGLLAPVRKGNARWYAASDRARLDLVLRCKRYGMTIEDICGLMQLYDPETGCFDQLPVVEAIARRQLDLLLRREADLSAAIGDLSGELKIATRWLKRKELSATSAA